MRNTARSVDTEFCTKQTLQTEKTSEKWLSYSLSVQLTLWCILRKQTLLMFNSLQVKRWCNKFCSMFRSHISQRNISDTFTIMIWWSVFHFLGNWSKKTNSIKLLLIYSLLLWIRNVLIIPLIHAWNPCVV